MPNIVLRAFGMSAVIVSLAACAGQKTASLRPAAGLGDSFHDTAAGQICQGYAARQKAQSAEVMYAQCMYARGYVVPGFTPSPDTPGYQGPLLGPATIGGGN